MYLLAICLLLTAVLHTVSSKDGMVTVEVNIPTIFNQLLDINKSLNTLRASVGYTGKGSLENALELVANKDNDKTSEENNQTRKDNTNSTDLNLIKVQVKGLEDMTSALKSMRRSSLNPDLGYQVTNAAFKKKKPLDPPPRGTKFLKKMRRINRMRKQLNPLPNIKFPGLFDPPSFRRMSWQELHPGVQKDTTLSYSPNHVTRRLQHLFDLKSKLDKEEAVHPSAENST